MGGNRAKNAPNGIKNRAKSAVVPWRVSAQRRFDLAVTDIRDQSRPEGAQNGAGPHYNGPQETRGPIGDYELQPTEGLVPSVLLNDESIDTPLKNAQAPEETAKSGWRIRLKGKQAAPDPLSLREINDEPEEPNPAGDERLELVETARESENVFEDVNLILD